MVRPPYFDRNGVKRGAWDEEEDNILRAYVKQHGHPNWRLLPSRAGLRRCGKSCRLRWVNYLKPGVRRGNFSNEERDLIIKLHALVGKKWSDIAKALPGRTDNDIKNYWHAHIQKRGKRSRPATRMIISGVDQMGQEEQSSELSSCLTTDNYHQEQTSFNDVFADSNPENTNAGHTSIWPESYYNDQPYFNQVFVDLPPFPVEEFFDFGLSENDMPTFSDSSDGGITDSWNSSPAESQEDFWPETFEEDTFDMVLWS